MAHSGIFINRAIQKAKKAAQNAEQLNHLDSSPSDSSLLLKKATAASSKKKNTTPDWTLKLSRTSASGTTSPPIGTPKIGGTAGSIRTTDKPNRLVSPQQSHMVVDVDEEGMSQSSSANEEDDRSFLSLLPSQQHPQLEAIIPPSSIHPSRSQQIRHSSALILSPSSSSSMQGKKNTLVKPKASTTMKNDADDEFCGLIETFSQSIKSTRQHMIAMQKEMNILQERVTALERHDSKMRIMKMQQMQ